MTNSRRNNLAFWTWFVFLVLCMFVLLGGVLRAQAPVEMQPIPRFWVGTADPPVCVAGDFYFRRDLQTWKHCDNTGHLAVFSDILPGTPPGGVGASCTAPQPGYFDTATGTLATCPSGMGHVWTAQQGAISFPITPAEGGTGNANTPGSAGHVLRSDGSKYVDSAIQPGDVVPTLAAAATALAADPADCSAGPPQQYAKTINASGTLGCGAIAAADIPFVTRALFVQTSTATVGNSVAEGTLTAAGTGSLTIPANLLAAGRSLRVRMYGIHSATGNPTIDIKVKLGSTVVLDTGAVNSHVSTNTAFLIDSEITVQSAGAMGTVMAQGAYTEFGNAAFGMANTGTQTVNTTGTLVLDITAQWGAQDPANTISATNFVLLFQ